MCHPKEALPQQQKNKTFSLHLDTAKPNLFPQVRSSVCLLPTFELP
jgi:hypothetical protein